MDAADLRGLWAVEGVADDDISRIAEAADEQCFAAGTRILRRGDRFEPFFFLIVQGTAEVEVDEEYFVERGPGQFFGEVGALGASAGYQTARTASVTATSDLVAAVIPGHAFGELVTTIPALRSRVYAELDRYAEG